MGKSKKRTIITVGVMVILAIGTLLFYFYMSNRTKSTVETVVEKSEIELILEKDFKQNYPASPREVIKIYSRMIKCLYSGISEKQVEALALKLRELYDEEFLTNNPVQEHLEEVKIEVDDYASSNRKISSYLIEKSSLVVYSAINKRECATLNASFKIREKSDLTKTTERFLLRLDGDGKWKILGWELIEDMDIDAE